jgi:hypothetical protein
MTIIWLILLTFVLVVLLGAVAWEKPDRFDPQETIHTIGIQARREAQDVSQEFLRRAIELLRQRRR